MKAILAAAFLLLSTSISQANVTKEDVRKLLSAGIPESTIVLFIQRHAPASPLSADDIADLKNAGAGESVLNALQEASKSPGYSPSTYTYSSYPYSPASYPYPYYYYPYYPYYPFVSFGFSAAHVHNHAHVHSNVVHHGNPHAVTAPHAMHAAPHGGGGGHGHR